MIKLSKHLSLPREVVTQTVAILARKRSGKSYTARRLSEQLISAGLQVVVVDPKGDWWGMRSSADGKSPGLSVIILGGEHGDIPLEVGGGEVVAKLVVEERVNVLLDLSLFRKHEVATFMTAFLESLYRLKAQEKYRTPVMLITDEADAIAPQKPQHGEERMLGAMEDIVRRGGQRGIGCTFVTQRSAVLNKNVLTQAQLLIAMRTIAPQDLKAMDAWIDVHGTPEQRQELMESLPSLPQGNAWFWSPGWPDDEGIFLKAQILPIETFDSGATPKPGERRIEPKKRAEVDLEAVRRQMLATVEKAKANDPSLLKKRVAELEKLLAAAASSRPGVDRPVVKEVKVEVPILKDGEVKRLEKAIEKLYVAQDRLAQAQQVVASEAGTLREKIAMAVSATTPVARAVAPPAPRGPFTRPTAPARPKPASFDGEVPDVQRGNSGLRRILIALAQRPQGLTARQIGVRAGLASGSGTFSNYMSTARTLGWIEGRGTTTITPAGLEALGSYSPLPEGRALAEHWLGGLGNSGAARILRTLLDAHPHALDTNTIAERTGMAAKSGTFSNYMSKLRTLELISGRGEIRASDELV